MASTKQTPSHLTEVNLFVSGYGLFGTVESLTLPAVKTKKEELNGQHVDMRKLEPMEFEAEVHVLNPVIFEEAQKLRDATIKAKGAYEENKTQKGATATLKGPIDVDPDAWKVGEVLKTTIKMYVNTYNLELDGTEVYDIDLPNHIAKIGGSDIYEQARSSVM